MASSIALEGACGAMDIYSHLGLAPTDAVGPRAALLLEGTWPAAAPTRTTLDEELDSRYRWLDAAASDLASEAAGPEGDPETLATVCGLNALVLRYWFVKLLRIVTWLDRHQAELEVPLVCHVERGRDEDVAALARAWGAAREVPIDLVWHEARRAPCASAPPNRWWRRAAGAWLARPVGSARGATPLVVLCGNPRLLNPLCAELLARRCRVAWLYDRFAVGNWWHWQGRGVEQIVCNGSLADAGSLPKRRRDAALVFEGLDLAPLLDERLERLVQASGAQQARILGQVSAHLHRLRPDHLVLDEDATPLARAAVAAARSAGVTSSVVQNAAPGIRFAFAPLAADRLLAWGNVARLQLVDWGIPPQRIAVTGSPWHDELSAQIAAQRNRQPCGQARLLLLATPPPKSERPDLVAYHKTPQSYRAMIEWCYDVAQTLGATLTVKLHPRAATGEPFRALAASKPGLEVTFVAQRPLWELFAASDAVVSMGSSAGIEATLAQVPVVQVMPSGSADLLPAKMWGMLGTARSRDELQVLLCRALGTGRTEPPSREVFAHLARPASMQIADLLLSESRAEPRRQVPSPVSGVAKPR
ncbi:MAG: hypothetical protein K1X74_12540 [Pirellulales bacterium]|nr:hypothetical protein [Pirellulales bacterium]